MFITMDKFAVVPGVLAPVELFDVVEEGRNINFLVVVVRQMLVA